MKKISRICQKFIMIIIKYNINIKSKKKYLIKKNIIKIKSLLINMLKDLT